MKSKFILVTLLAILITQGCTYRVNSIKYDDSLRLKKNDLFYHLPKTLLVFTITYKVVETTSIKNGVADEPRTEYFVKSAEVKPSTANDPDQLYVARGKNISHKFFLKENVDFKFNDKGVIQSLETTFEDKTLETTESLFNGISAITESVTLAGEGGDVYLTDLKDNIKKAYDNLALAISRLNKEDVDKYKAQLKNYFELLSDYNDKNKEITKESDKMYTLLIDPNQMQSGPNNTKEYIFKPITIMPEIKLVIKLDTNKCNNQKVLSTGKEKDGHVSIPGLVYNLPASLKTTVLSSSIAAPNQIIFENYIDYAQLGNLGVVPVTSKIFTSRKTNVEFSPITGALTVYKTESGSSSENLGKTIENAANVLKTTVTKIKYDNKIDALKKQKELMDLQDQLKDKPESEAEKLQTSIEVLKLQLEMKKIQQEIDEMEKKK